MQRPEEGTGWLLRLLARVQLQQYFLRLRDDFSASARLSHFEYVETGLEKIVWAGPVGGGVGLAYRAPWTQLVTLFVLRTASLVEEASPALFRGAAQAESSHCLSKIQPPQVGREGVSVDAVHDECAVVKVVQLEESDLNFQLLRINTH